MPRKPSITIGSFPAGGKRAKKVKRTICLSAEASRRLDVHALGLGLDVSQVVESYVLSLTRFVLSDRGRGGVGAPEAESPPEALTG